MKFDQLPTDKKNESNVAENQVARILEGSNNLNELQNANQGIIEDEDLFLAIEDYCCGEVTSEQIPNDSGAREIAESTLQRELDSESWDDLKRSLNGVESKLTAKNNFLAKEEFEFSEAQSAKIEALQTRSQQYLEASLASMPDDEMDKFLDVTTKKEKLYNSIFEKSEDQGKLRVAQANLFEIQRVKDAIRVAIRERAAKAKEVGEVNNEDPGEHEDNTEIIEPLNAKHLSPERREEVQLQAARMRIDEIIYNSKEPFVADPRLEAQLEAFMKKIQKLLLEKLI